MATSQVAASTARGFTLLEVLVVMLIVGLLVGLATALVMPDDRARLRVETDRLARLLELGAEEARLGGGAIAWTAEPGGYRFWEAQDGGGWTPVSGHALFSERTLPEGMAITALRIENAAVADPMRLQFTADDMPLAFGIDLASGRERFTIESSPIGEVTVVGTGDRDGGQVEP